MGARVSTPEKLQNVRNRQIDAELEMAEQQSHKVISLLLLGAAEGGKSTVVKQMRILHKDGFTPEEFEAQKGVIYANTLQSISAIVMAMNVLHIAYSNPDNEDFARTLLEVTRERQENGDMSPLPADVVRAIKRLWIDRGVRECFTRSSEYQLNDSAQYLIDSVDRISGPNYRPSVQDLLRARVRTDTIIEIDFQVKQMIFRVVDVGGQRSERRKWIHCFDNVRAVIFVSSLSEYDQKLGEDRLINRMVESIHLFDAICNSHYFEKSSMILFLNKKDIFEEKIKRTSLKVAFTDYDGTQDYDDCTQFIEQKFKGVSMNAKREIYSHQTCATDTTQIQFVISATLNMLINKHLKHTGMA